MICGGTTMSNDVDDLDRGALVQVEAVRRLLGDDATEVVVDMLDAQQVRSGFALSDVVVTRRHALWLESTLLEHEPEALDRLVSWCETQLCVVGAQHVTQALEADDLDTNAVLYV